MTWIQTVRMEDDGCVKNAIESQRKLYPTEYATPVQPVNNGETAGIVASHTLIPDTPFHAFSTFGALMSPASRLTRVGFEAGCGLQVSLTPSWWSKSNHLANAGCGWHDWNGGLATRPPAATTVGLAIVVKRIVGAAPEAMARQARENEPHTRI